MKTFIDIGNIRLVNVLADQESRSPQRIYPAPDKLIATAVVISLGFHVGIFLLAPWMLPKVRDHRNAALAVWLVEKPASPQLPDPSQKTVVALATTEPKKPRDARFLAEQDHATEKEQKAPINGTGDDSRESGQNSYYELNEEANSVAKPTVDRFLNHPKKRKNQGDDVLGIKAQLNSENSRHTNSSFDLLKDVEMGDKTNLNAWQWRHAPFFNRIKSAIGQVWSPQQQIRRFDPKGTLLGHKDL
ncbi:MAG TPA: hypothetical protein VEL47_08110, partial [Myxococcota bacterium]|nr:hypothetical protein [Myxococcota bacterium]